MALAARIDDMLAERGLSKAQFAKFMGKEPSVISKWLSGTHNFTMDTLSEISDCLGYPLSKFFEEKESPMLYSKQYAVKGMVSAKGRMGWSFAKPVMPGQPAIVGLAGLSPGFWETGLWAKTESINGINMITIPTSAGFLKKIPMESEESEAYALLNAKSYLK